MTLDVQFNVVFNYLEVVPWLHKTTPTHDLVLAIMRKMVACLAVITGRGGEICQKLRTSAVLEVFHAQEHVGSQ